MIVTRLAKLLLWVIPIFAQDSAEKLDAAAKKVIAQERVVGVSVLLARGNRIIFHKGYGFADLGLEASSKDETVYHVVGPMLPLTGIAIMQLWSAAKYLSKIPSQNSFPNFL